MAAFFCCPTYHVTILESTGANMLLIGSCLLDTGAGSKLDNISFLPPQWGNRIKQADFSILCSAVQQAFHIYSILQMVVRISDIHVLVWFGDVENLAVHVLLSTSFIDCYIRTIFRCDGKVVPLHSRLASIFSSLLAVSSLLSDISVLNVQYTRVTKCNDM